MKLLFIIHNIAYCGAERVLSILVNELAERGHQVYVLTDPNKVAYRIDPNVTILDAYRGIDMSVKKGIVGTVFRYFKLMFRQYGIIKHTLQDVNPDVTVSFMGMCIWQLFPFRKKFQIIISDHSSMERSFSRLVDYERKYLPARFNCQTVLTQSDKEYLKRLGRTNVIVMHDPLTFSPISEEEYEELFPQRARLFACGSVDRYHIKGIDNLIKAFALASTNHSDWQLDIAGGGNDSKFVELRQIAIECGVEKQVHFLGFHEDVDVLMKTHSLFVLSSRSEGFGMVLTEAMASGCPVISYELSGPSEIIDNNVDGLLVNNQNIEEMARAITEMMSDTGKRYSLGKKALQSVHRFSPKSIVSQWESLFLNIKSDN